LYSSKKDQSVLFPYAEESPKFLTKRIQRRTSLDNMLKSYRKSLKVISCWHSLETVLEYFEKGFEEITLVVGDSITDNYRTDLSGRIEICEQLYDYYKSGKLTIYVTSDKQIHSKFFLVENNTHILASNGSLNFTKNATKATHQVNYQWALEFEKGRNYDELNTLIGDYEWHKAMCRPFFGELDELISKNRDQDEKEVMEQWIVSHTISDEEEMTKLISDLNREILSGSLTPEQIPVIRINPSAGSKKIKKMEELLKPFEPTRVDDGLAINPKLYLDHRSISYPMMRVDMDTENVSIGMSSERKNLTVDSIPPKLLDKYLEHIERYILTAKRSKTRDVRVAMLSMYEALLCVLSAPFSTEYHKMNSRQVGGMQKRGPRILHLFGPSSNGKTHFFWFASKLLTGERIDSLAGEQISKKAVRGYLMFNSAFPMMYDDLPSNKWNKGGPMDPIIKNYWDTWWAIDYVFPQLILSSNDRCPPGPIKSRVKEIEFAMKFQDSPENKQHFWKLLTFENQIFKLFTSKYINKLKNPKLSYCEEELVIARECFKEMYQEAGRPLPDFFPVNALETYVDSGREMWYDLIKRDGKAILKRNGNALQIRFDKDMNSAEIGRHLKCLPNDMLHRRNGSLITIVMPEDFEEWYGPINKVDAVKKKVSGWFKRKKQP